MIQDTSLNAYFEEKKNHSEQRSRIRNLLSVCGSLTNREIAAITDLQTSSVSGRINELRNKDNIVAFCEKRICSISGKRVNAWKLIQ